MKEAFTHTLAKAVAILPVDIIPQLNSAMMMMVVQETGPFSGYSKDVA